MSGKRTAWMLGWFVVVMMGMVRFAFVAVQAEHSIWPVFPIALIAALIITAAMEDAP